MESLLAGSTSNIIYVMAYNSVTGAKKTGLAYNTATLAISYKRDAAAAAVAVTPVDCTLGTYTSGGFKEVSSSAHPGLYEFHPPNAAIDVGAEKVIFSFEGIADVNFPPKGVQLTATDTDTINTDLDAISAQIAGIGSGTGSSTNAAPDADNSAAPLNGVTNVGTVVGTFANVAGDDGTYQVITNVTGGIDFVYGYSLGAGRSATQVTFTGYLAAAAPATSKNITVQAYNFSTPGWDTRATIVGQAGTTDITEDIKLLPVHTGSGANVGKVYIRFLCAGMTGAVLNVDTLLGSVSGVAGDYSDGAVWVDENDGQSGTVPYTNGTTGNPCPWADAIVIAAAVGLKRFRIANDSTITLTASAADYSLIGDHWYLDMNGQSINDAYIKGAEISGIGTASIHTTVEKCLIDGTTIPPGTYTTCGFGDAGGTCTAGSNGEYVFVDGYSLVPGAGTPVFDFNTNITGASGFNFRRWSGGSNITINDFCDLTMEVLAGGGQTITTGGGNAEIRGIFREATINSTGDSLTRLAGVTGNVTVNGDGGEVRVYGVGTGITDNSTGVTIVNGWGVPSAADNATAVWEDAIDYSSGSKGYAVDGTYKIVQQGLISPLRSAGGWHPDDMEMTADFTGITGTINIRAYNPFDKTTIDLWIINSDNPTGLKDPSVEWADNTNFHCLLEVSFTFNDPEICPAGTMHFVGVSERTLGVDFTINFPEVTAAGTDKRYDGDWFPNMETGEYWNYQGGFTGYYAMDSLRSAVLALPTAAETATAVRIELAPELAEIIFLAKLVRNKKEVKKVGAVWYLIVYDDDDTTEILNKALKNKLGGNISDLAAGALAQELASTV